MQIDFLHEFLKKNLISKISKILTELRLTYTYTNSHIQFRRDTKIVLKIEK